MGLWGGGFKDIATLPLAPRVGTPMGREPCRGAILTMLGCERRSRTPISVLTIFLSIWKAEPTQVCHLHGATMQLLMGPFPLQQQNSPKTLQKRSLPRSQPKPWAPAANVPVPIPIPVPRMFSERIRAPSPPHPHGHSPSSSVFWQRTGRPCPSPRSCTPRRWLPWQDRGCVRPPGCSRDRGAPLVPQPCHKIPSFASAGS